MKHLGLFEGIGGFSLAARWMGWQTVAWCEWNPFGQQVLKHHFPDAIGHGDITKTDFTPYANRIDIISGGFPCQPYSQAGKRLGKEDERHLWPHMLRAIKEVQPGWIVGENVSGLLNWNGGLVLDEIKTDLEGAGFEVIPPCILPACGKNAPHRRDRVWIIAYSHSNRNRNIRKQDRKANSLQAIHREAVCAGQSAGTDTGDAANSKKSIQRKQQGQNRSQQDRQFTHDGSTWDAADTGHAGLQGSAERRSLTGSRQGQHQQPAGFLRTDWQEFPTQSPLCTGNDGIPARLDTTALSFSKWRNESIKAAGNAIVPQVVYEIFKAIQAYENL